jgi:hypothetical protein
MSLYGKKGWLMGRSVFLILACAMGAMAQTANAAETQPSPPAQAVPQGVDGGQVLVPATLEYQWIFRVPVVTIEHRRVAVTAPSVSTHSRRWNYEMPAFRDKRIKLWDAPEFSCKYPDLLLPNECRTVWHGVYVDVPVLVSERGHVDIDVPRIAVKEQFIEVDVPRWTWVDKRFRLSLPAIAPPETVRRLRIALDGQRADLAASTDETIATITREIEAVRASGEDPSRLLSPDGSSLDLLAELRSLVDQRTQELERLAAIDAELAQLSTH